MIPKKYRSSKKPKPDWLKQLTFKNARMRPGTNAQSGDGSLIVQGEAKQLPKSE